MTAPLEILLSWLGVTFRPESSRLIEYRRFIEELGGDLRVLKMYIRVTRCLIFKQVTRHRITMCGGHMLSPDQRCDTLIVQWSGL